MRKKNTSSPVKAVLKLTILLLLAFGGQFATAQSSLLNRRVSLDVEQQTLSETLFLIGKTASFNVSWNTQSLPGDSLVSLAVSDQTVRDVLETLLGERYLAKPLGNNLIIQRAPLKQKTEPEAPKKFLIRGILQHAVNQQPIAKATIYENLKNRTALSDSEGRFEMELPWTSGQVALSLSKVGFEDTIVVIYPKREVFVTVGLMPAYYPVEAVPSLAAGPLSAPGPRVEDVGIARFFVPKQQRNLAANIWEGIQVFPVKLGLWPGISTHGKLNGGMTNVVAINGLAGYSYGVRGFEVAGLFNITREEMIGVQVGGLGNVTGGPVKGVQIGGLYNHISRDFNGFQLGGIGNFVKGSFRGMQFGGLFNANLGQFSGFQLSGFANYAFDGMSGVQTAGFLNVAHKGNPISQIAGFANFSDSIVGTQIGGFLNVSHGILRGPQISGALNLSTRNAPLQISGLGNVALKKASGPQVSGLFNVGKEIHGVQIAGLANYSKVIKGAQIGLFNVADTLKGVQIGILSWSKTGHVRFEVSASELLSTSVRLKSGAKGFYTIVGFGTNRLTGSNRQDGYSLGLGSRADIGRVFLEGEATATQFHWKEDQVLDGMNMVISATPRLGVRVLGPLEVFGGLSANYYISTVPGSSPTQPALDIPSRIRYSNQVNNTVQLGWLGWRAGIQLALNGVWKSPKPRRKAAEEEEKTEL